MAYFHAFAFMSALALLASCTAKSGDTRGSSARPVSPLQQSFKLTGEDLNAARTGHLGLKISTGGAVSGIVMPVQWDLSDTASYCEGIMLVPPGQPAGTSFVLTNCSTPFSSTMKAAEDPGSGQIIITDEGAPVLRYNYKTVYEKDAIDTLPANKYNKQPNDTFMANPSIYAVPRSDYIHPVYGPSGEMLTRDWSKDHPHHRGIYWAWPEVGFGKKMGDLHALQIVFARPTGNIQLQSGPVFAQIEAENNWMWGDSTPIVRETAVIRAYRSTVGGRVIDLAFRFEALKDSITLARRETTHYGGLNIRMHTPGNQEISSFLDPSLKKPRRAWSDLSGLFAGAPAASGMLVLQHHLNPDYPGDYIQYPDLAWIQPGFPEAGTRFKLLPGKPLVLRFRVFVHSGMKPDDYISSLLWDAFNDETSPLPPFSFLQLNTSGR
jgi:hypothetical protein